VEIGRSKLDVDTAALLVDLPAMMAGRIRAHA
jgi:hypothetical protein